ncbi:MAG: YceD family protein [Halocynthiibacter sp.]
MPEDMKKNAKNALTRPVSDLKSGGQNRFELVPDEVLLRKYAADLDLLEIRKLRFEGTITAMGKNDWRVRGKIGASVIQPCSVTLEPVLTRLDKDMHREFIKGMSFNIDDDEEEVEMSEDENRDPLGTEINLESLMLETLVLNVPIYPRKEDAEIKTAVFTEPGKAAMRDEDTRPFAGLSALKEQLEGNKTKDNDDK